MRTKMSPRRALATSFAMAIFPTLLFFVSPNRNSLNSCKQFSEKLIVAVERKAELNQKCQKEFKNNRSFPFSFALIASIFINWPVIRWLDDRQWYREWIKNEQK